MQYKKEFIGEALGTFILVLFGCGSVAGGMLTAVFFVRLIEPAMKRKSDSCNCK